MTAARLKHTYEGITQSPEFTAPEQPASYRNVMLRVRRAISWIAYAEEQITRGLNHTAFCFYWIAFNSCYGYDVKNERDQFIEYLKEIIRHDKQKQVCKCILYEIRGDVEDLVRCRFAFDQFWREGHHRLHDEKWRSSLKSEIDTLRDKLSRGMDMAAIDVLEILFSRIYSVRNQVMHGSTTRERSTGDDQIRYSSIILDRLIPVFVDLMLCNRHEGEWSRPYYPGERLQRSDDGSYVLESGHPWRS